MSVKEWLFGNNDPEAAKKRAEATADALRDKYDWQKVKAPFTWHPREPGEELCGYYGGKTVRNGRFGQYEIVLVHVPRRGTLTVSGIRIIQLMDAAMIGKGHPVRIVYRGTKPLQDDHEMKLFDLLVAEGDPIAEEDLPVVNG